MSTATTTTTTSSSTTTLLSSPPFTCKVKGCCVPRSNDPLALTRINDPTKPTSTSSSLVQELYSTVTQLPSSACRFINDVWLHFSDRPKKPLWNIQTTVVMAFLQAFRDQSLTNSLEFWRTVLIAPTYLTPLTAKTEDGSFRVRPRGLSGILRECDEAEDGHRWLDAEWMSAGTVWDRCSSVMQKKVDRTAPLENQAKSATSALVLRSRSPEKVVLYLHGGAYCAMSAQTHRTLTHKISKATGRRIFALNYRLAPETRFPGGLYDAVQAFLYLIDADHGYSLEPKNILIMGDSAGGGLGLALLLYLRDHGLPQPEGGVFLSPWVDLSFSFPSWEQASLYDYLPNNPSTLEKMNPAFLYLGPEQPVDMVQHPYVSPLFAENFENLPPLLIQSGGCESLRDEIEDLTCRIGATKTTLVTHEIYEDMVHVFQAFPFSKSSDAIESIGWWARFGMPMIAQWQARGQLPSFAPQDPFQNQVPTGHISPRALGRRFHSIPG